MFALVVLDLVFQYLAKRLARKNVYKMIYLMLGGTYSLNPINQTLVKSCSANHKGSLV